jgi:hypothetical protein
MAARNFPCPANLQQPLRRLGRHARVSAPALYVLNEPPALRIDGIGAYGNSSGLKLTALNPQTRAAATHFAPITPTGLARLERPKRASFFHTVQQWHTSRSRSQLLSRCAGARPLGLVEHCLWRGAATLFAVQEAAAVAIEAGAPEAAPRITGAQRAWRNW